MSLAVEIEIPGCLCQVNTTFHINCVLVFPRTSSPWLQACFQSVSRDSHDKWPISSSNELIFRMFQTCIFSCMYQVNLNSSSSNSAP
ncbi:hypothetical protein CFIMG_006468RA [Ceratocystis fimbriata CBS 114723]|uniref:Uncharacterized protein n=1 Tax=Ceratocystis fimbriata CBS 114723 TaxID=1035309 RepID=A0A2C5WD00_9PEZI|nr:hypothetical protein CFIMG_006468RA [Ceratocystis fimbriata CBS 114723]